MHLVKVVCDVFEKNLPNLNPVQWSETFVGRFERFARPARYLYFRVLCIFASQGSDLFPERREADQNLRLRRWVLWRWRNQCDPEGMFQNNEKSSEIDKKRIRKAPYLAQYTKIGKAIKRFRKAALTDLDQCQFVLKVSGHLSFIILNQCTK